MTPPSTMNEPTPPPLMARSQPKPAYSRLIDGRRTELQQQLLPILAQKSSFVWEVGCGHGHFLTAYAEAHPDQTCIGVDMASERIERADRKRNRAKLANLHFIRGEATLFLEALPPAVTLARIFVLFPDPWPKSRHHKHRILREEFLKSTASRATPDCQLHFRTDFEPYFANASATVQQSQYWQLPSPPVSWPFEYATVFQNRAERHESFTAVLRPH